MYNQLAQFALTQYREGNKVWARVCWGAAMNILTKKKVEK